jgi:hypothetical protein
MWGWVDNPHATAPDETRIISLPRLRHSVIKPAIGRVYFVLVLLPAGAINPLPTLMTARRQGSNDIRSINNPLGWQRRITRR